MVRLFSRLPVFAFFFLILAAQAQAYGGPADLVPPQGALPKAAGLLKLILLVTFFIHLLLVNTLVGTAVVTFVRSFRKPEAPVFSLPGETSPLPKVLALAVNFGVAPYLLVQVLYGSFLYPATVLMALWWLSIVAFVMLSYYGLYIVSDKSSAILKMLPLRLLLLAIIIMLLFTMSLLATNSTLTLRPEYWERWIEVPHGIMMNFGDPTFLPRYLHFVTASLAVGGLVLAIRGWWKKDRQKLDPQSADAQKREGLAWFRYASMVQAAIGVWFLLSLPAEVRALFLGKSLIATAALALALTGILIAMVTSFRGYLLATCLIAPGVVFIMVCMRDIVRDAMLAPYITPAPASVAENLLPLPHGQTGGLVLFLGCTALAIVAIVYLARVTLNAFRHPRPAAGGDE